MSNKHKLTEKLKVMEDEVYANKVDLNSINSKLEAAYQYEEDLLLRLKQAREKTEQLRKDFFIKAQEISQQYREMKNIFDIFTGNFYKN